MSFPSFQKLKTNYLVQLSLKLDNNNNNNKKQVLKNNTIQTNGCFKLSVFFTKTLKDQKRILFIFSPPFTIVTDLESFQKKKKKKEKTQKLSWNFNYEQIFPP